MNKKRIAAFTDSVIAIIMTILVLTIKQPKEATMAAIWDLRDSFLAYAISFLLCTVLWNNHHHLFQIVRKVNGRVLWTNCGLIFIMSLFPYMTLFVSNNFHSIVAEIAYGIVFVFAHFIYYLLCRALVNADPEYSRLKKVLSNVREIYITMVILTAGFLVGIFIPSAVIISCLISIIVWVIPNKRAEALFYNCTDDNDCMI